MDKLTERTQEKLSDGAHLPLLAGETKSRARGKNTKKEF